ncbi:ubiquinol-cytochrome-c reductase complex assembly factor 1-like [Schistocerca gregaria]|uniref:ubiquinol-cytochrome-c reductase complex assembly factor 1-like n=1 Tax=Schistocerca gregaria TaxID=7010 RepID=UPI00211E3257|nr:ubiquinol-cytochrome-c reductase complex assembly factor 1-like [Schistocerca gregaria]
MNYQRLLKLCQVPTQCYRRTIVAEYLKPTIVSSSATRCHCFIHTSVPVQKETKVLAVGANQSDDGVIRKLTRRLGVLDHSKSKLKRAGYLLYENAADRIDYKKFFKVFQMPDTLNSWFLITELHVWMLMVRSMAADKEGRYLRNIIVEAMWNDVSARAKKLGAANPGLVREQLSEMSEQFQAAIMGYDEGLLSDDKVLAGAVWRRFFERNCNNPEAVECLVRYIRKQIKLLDEIGINDLISNPDITWLPAPIPSDVRDQELV